MQTKILYGLRSIQSARGENSVGALRFIKKLVDSEVAATVLGNHDLTLLAWLAVLRIST